jgi:hypothetical protein
MSVVIRVHPNTSHWEGTQMMLVTSPQRTIRSEYTVDK